MPSRIPAATAAAVYSIVGTSIHDTFPSVVVGGAAAAGGTGTTAVWFVVANEQCHG